VARLLNVAASMLLLVVGSAVDTWATVAVAIGTIGTVVYALFRDAFVTPRRRPKLELRFDGSGSDQVVVRTAEGDAASIRLRVVNRPGKDTADDVVVLVTEVRRLEDETMIAEATPIVLPLTWSGSSPPLTVASVHPGSERHIDLVHVDLPARNEIEIGRRWSETVPLHLDVTPKPTGGQDDLGSGKLEIAVEVRARNADAVCYVIPVSWDGQWSGQAAIWDHLSVEAPRKVR
jgi:hypothetical protein